MVSSTANIENELLKIRDNRFDVRTYFSLIFANRLAEKVSQHEHLHVIDELVTEENLAHHLEKEYRNRTYVLMFYAHKPISTAVSPYYPMESRAHTSLLLCEVKESKISHVLNIDGYDFPSYVNPASNPRIHKQLILRATGSNGAGKIPLQRASWDNMNCVFFAFTFAQRILELFKSLPEIAERLSQDNSFLEEEILQGMVGKYVKKSGSQYFYDRELTEQHHNKLREETAKALLEQTRPHAALPPREEASTLKKEPTKPQPQPNQEKKSFLDMTWIILGGVISVLGFAAAAIMFTVFNMATLGIAGIAIGLVGLGLFAGGFYKHIQKNGSNVKSENSEIALCVSY